MKKIIIIIHLLLHLSLTAAGQEIKEISTDSITFHRTFTAESLSEESPTLSTRGAQSDYYGSFKVGGDESTFYPVIFKDNAWTKSRATILEIGRSHNHTDKTWHGSLLSEFRFHLTQWGHGANFIDAHIKQLVKTGKPFIAGWQDATGENSTYSLIVWLRGNSTYYYNSNYSQSPTLTNGPVVIAGITYDVKTGVDAKVNGNGTSLSNPLWVNSTESNYFAGNVGLGIRKPAYKLDVNGTIRAKEIKIETGWADFVFDTDYRLPALSEVESHIREHKHLPGIPSERRVKEEGVNLGEMQVKLLQKIEELTLYVIAQDKKIQELETLIKDTP